MPAWQPTYFPEITFPVRNRGTDECILTCITFECLSISEQEATPQSSGEPAEKRRDLCYAIIIDLDNPQAPQSFPLSVPIPPGETLEVVVAVGAKRSVRTRFVLHFQYDRRGEIRSAEVALNITNNGGFERCYRPGIALDCLTFLRAKRPSDLQISTGAKPTDMLLSLYHQNRPLNVDYLRIGGPGSAYFFSANEGPLLPTSVEAPIQLEYSTDPTVYVAVGPFYAVRHLTEAEALDLALDPRLAPPLAAAAHSPTLYGLNQYGACSVADVSSGFAITQILPGCGLTGINTEIFTENSAARFIGATERDGLSLIPIGEIHQLAINTVNRYLDVLKEICDLHGPVFIRAGLVNVQGLTLAHVQGTGAFEGGVVARGPLRNEEYTFLDLLAYPDPYQNGRHVVGPLFEIIADDALRNGRMPRIFSRE
ncbi:hypothetical protein GOC53_05490 [Sinorhizobium medicae]|nr:hypothetical protein [Sinorhizobium medicae]MDX0539644.1 hypothetical protein [Sinorhizobium medicae]